MKEDILAIFQLQGLGRKLEGFEVRDKDVVLHFRESRRARCPGCGRWSCRRHARLKPRLVYHGVVFGRRIWLGLRNNRYLCRACGKPFTEANPFIRPRQRRNRRSWRRSEAGASRVSTNGKGSATASRAGSCAGASIPARSPGQRGRSL